MDPYRPPEASRTRSLIHLAQPEMTENVQAPRLTNCFLVEDSPVIRKNLVSTLEELLPMRVVASADDEAGALEWIRSSKERCDLMIIDIFLKSGSGLGVLRQAREMLPQTRMVVLSNYATPDMRRRCLELGADRVFDKSGELEELLTYCEQLTDEPS